MGLNKTEELISDIKKGKMVLLMDDESFQEFMLQVDFSYFSIVEITFYLIQFIPEKFSSSLNL